MSIKRILKIGLVAIMASALTVVAQVPKPKPDKPAKEKPERGKKWDSAKVKERLKAAFEKRAKNRKDAKKRGHKVHDRKKKDSGFGKLVRDDAKIKELKEAFAKATKERKGAFDRDTWKDATDEEKKALREKMAAGRKEWMEQMKAHRKEVHARIKEIREEFKNNRDEVIDGNKPGG
jgi:Spy/CpxP family protein refolding chaperone